MTPTRRADRACEEGEASTARSVLPRWTRDCSDVDEMVVDRLLAGIPTNYTSWERREAVRRLLASGVTQRGIAYRLRIDKRQVWRDVSWLRTGRAI